MGVVDVYAAKIPPEAAATAIGFYLLAWGIFTLHMTIPAMNLIRPVLAVFALLTITFFVLASGNSQGTPPAT